VTAIAGSAAARTFTVNALEDRTDVLPGDGLCDADAGAPGEQCTLRAAVQEANATPGTDTIELPAGGYELGLRGSGEDAAASGDLDLTDDVDVIGAGEDASFIVARKVKDRALDVLPGVTVSLLGVRVTEGRSPRRESGGCIRSRGALTLVASRLALCRSRRDGGGLYSQAGTLTLMDVKVFGGAARRDGGGVDIDGGTATVTNAEITKCIARREGAGLDNSGGVVTLSNVRIASNTRPRAGGAISDKDGGMMVLDGCTVAGNCARTGAEISNRDTGLGPSTVTVRDTLIGGGCGGRGNGACIGSLIDGGGNTDAGSCL